MEHHAETPIELSDRLLENHLHSERPLRLRLVVKEEAGSFEHVETRIIAGIRDGLWLCEAGTFLFLLEERGGQWISYQNELLEYANRSQSNTAKLFRN